MKKNLYTFLILMFGFLLLNGATTDGTTIKPKGGCATTTATKGPSTAKVVCIKEEDRNIFQKYWCRYMAQIGRMCKLEYDCLKVKKNKTDEENKRLEDEAKIQALCEDMSYKHVASKNGFLLEAAKTGSKQIGKIPGKKRSLGEIDLVAKKGHNIDLYEVKCSHRILKAKKQLKRMKRLMNLDKSRAYFYCGSSECLIDV